MGGFGPRGRLLPAWDDSMVFLELKVASLNFRWAVPAAGVR